MLHLFVITVIITLVANTTPTVKHKQQVKTQKK